VAVPPAEAAYSASINSHFSLPMLRCKVRRCFCQEGALHLKLAVLPLQLAQPGAVVRDSGVSAASPFFSLYARTQLPSVVSCTPYSRATSVIARDVSITSLTTSSRNSGEYFLYPLTFPPVLSAEDPKGSAVRKTGGTSTGRLRALRGEQDQGPPGRRTERRPNAY
jgi:hypothetical protein